MATILHIIYPYIIIILSTGYNATITIKDHGCPMHYIVRVGQVIASNLS